MKKPSKLQNFIERYYSRGVFPRISSVQSKVSDSVPVNIGDIELVAPFVLGLPPFKNNKYAKGLSAAINVHSMIGLSYMLNNFRVPLEYKLGIDPVELVDTTVKPSIEHVARELDATYKRIQSSGKPLSDDQILAIADQSLDNVMQKIEGYTVRGPKTIKRGVRIQMMHKLGVEGQFVPSTHEINIPVKEEPLSPFVVTHEKAHSKGYSREHEANMIAYLASMESNDDRFKASAYFWRAAYGLTCLQGTLGDKLTFLDSLTLPHSAKDKYEAILIARENGPGAFSKVQNVVLKVFGEKEGVKSYNETFTKLIIAYDNSNHKL